MVDRTKASELYNAWLLEHLKGSPHRGLSEANGHPPQKEELAAKAENVTPGSLLHVSSNPSTGSSARHGTGILATNFGAEPEVLERCQRSHSSRRS
jgi:hypothetical protein